MKMIELELKPEGEEKNTALPSKLMIRRAAYEMPDRLKRERRTIYEMMKIYCSELHNTEIFCEDCTELLKYAEIRVEKCRFQEEKPTCGNCPIHCYRKSKAREIKKVMRYAGPRMTFKHPILAIHHLLDGRKKVEHPVR